MGNKLVRRRYAVDEKYTRPQGLYQLGRDIDHKKLKKLILDSKLAPCYPGKEECSSDLEECPICFLYYPSLNRSRCCLKGICTECFLQMKPPHTTRPTQCPFCKTPNYAVEYRGVKTKEERGKEQIEEQRVIEAQIRVQQQELHEEEEEMLQRNGRNSSMTLAAMEVEDRSVTSQSVSAPSHTPLQIEDITPCDDSLITPADRQSLHTRPNREEEFDLDLEDIMVMEAIWLSIQEQDSQRLMSGGGVSTSHPSSLEDQLAASSYQMMDASPSAGFACAIASMAERQHMDSDCSRSSGQVECRSSTYSESEGRPAATNHVQESWIEVSPGTGRALPRDEVPWGREQGSEGADSRPSYTSSSVHSASDALDSSSPPMRDMEGVVDHSQNAEHGVTPEAFEDQMMLAMAMSLAEARARPYTLGPWH